MASNDDKRVAIARVYARSLLDLAVDGEKADDVLGELRGLADLVGRDEDLATFFESPLIEFRERSESLEKMFRGRLDDIVVDALQVMHRKGRLGLVAELATAYRDLLQVRLGRVDVRVASAVALDETSRKHLIETLREVTGKEPVLAETVLPELLGGLVLRIGDRKIDGSVRREIRTIRDRLHQRAARQILQSRAQSA